LLVHEAGRFVQPATAGKITVSDDAITPSPEDKKKAQIFFERARTVAATGSHDYAIEMFLQGLSLDPENVTAHQALRETSMVRKASGGKALGMMDAMKLKKAKDDKLTMLQAERGLAFDPGNMDWMVQFLQGAVRTGFHETAMWIGNILLRANHETKKPSYEKFIILKNAYKELNEWELAVESAKFAAQLKPDDMELQAESKNLAAELAMKKGKYDKTSMDSVRDKDTQDKLLRDERDVRDMDFLGRLIAECEAEFRAEPNEAGKLMKYVEALEKTEDVDYENKALEALEAFYARTKQFRFRRRIGAIKMKQLGRMERSLRAAVQETPGDEGLKKDYADFRREQFEFELSEYRMWADNYPTELGLQFEVAKRLFVLKQHEDAIPVLQDARQDPKLKYQATLYLGRAFYETQFLDEAVETLQGILEEYQTRDDTLKQILYWLGRALEDKGDRDAAIKRYSQLAQMEFKYADVQLRIRALRSQPSA